MQKRDWKCSEQRYEGNLAWNWWVEESAKLMAGLSLVHRARHLQQGRVRAGHDEDGVGKQQRVGRTDW